jgi:hypothetical protein
MLCPKTACQREVMSHWNRAIEMMHPVFRITATPWFARADLGKSLQAHRFHRICSNCLIHAAPQQNSARISATVASETFLATIPWSDYAIPAIPKCSTPCVHACQVNCVDFSNSPCHLAARACGVTPIRRTPYDLPPNGRCAYGACL